jgi:hypothetical protein
MRRGSGGGSRTPCSPGELGDGRRMVSIPKAYSSPRCLPTPSLARSTPHPAGWPCSARHRPAASPRPRPRVVRRRAAPLYDEDAGKASAPAQARGEPPTNAFVNLSILDRTVRILVGVIMLAAGWWLVKEAIWKVSLDVYGWVPVASGCFGWDPVYAILGLSTNRRRTQGKTP